MTDPSGPMEPESIAAAEERARRRIAVASQDRQLLPLFISTRPTCDEPGVMLGIEVDDGRRPLGLNEVVGRLTEEQALGLARSLLMMVRISREEHSDG